VAVDRVFFGVPIMAAMPAAVTAPRIALPSMILSPERIGYSSTGQNPTGSDSSPAACRWRARFRANVAFTAPAVGLWCGRSASRGARGDPGS
jgi:hypothetical protein